MKKNVTYSIEETTIAKFDVVRGNMPKSTYMNQLMEVEIERVQNKTQIMNGIPHGKFPVEDCIEPPHEIAVHEEIIDRCSHERCGKQAEFYMKTALPGMNVYVLLCYEHVEMLHAYTFLQGLIERRDGIPVVKCVEDGKRLKFFCPFCQKVHYHGKPEGHRVAHCPMDGLSPYLETGYFLELPGGLGLCGMNTIPENFDEEEQRRYLNPIWLSNEGKDGMSKISPVIANLVEGE